MVEGGTEGSQKEGNGDLHMGFCALGQVVENRLKLVLHPYMIHQSFSHAVSHFDTGNEQRGEGMVELTLFESILDGWERCDDSLRVGDFVTIHGNVKVDTDQDLFVLEVQIGDGELVG